MDRRERGRAFRMEDRRAVIALDDDDRPAGFEDAPRLAERPDGIAEVFEHETYEDVIERAVGEGKGREVRAQKISVCRREALFRDRERRRRDIDAGEARVGPVTQQRPRLRADSATRFENTRTDVEMGAVMQQFVEGARLVRQARGLVSVVAMYVVDGHVAVPLLDRNCPMRGTAS